MFVLVFTSNNVGRIKKCFLFFSSERAWADELLKYFRECDKMSIVELILERERLIEEEEEWGSLKRRKKVRGKNYLKQERLEMRAQYKRKHVESNLSIKSVGYGDEEYGKRARQYGTQQELEQIKELKERLFAAKEKQMAMYRYTGIPKLLGHTSSSIINGVAASKVAGPLGGGLAYAATELKNDQIRHDNFTIGANNDAVKAATDSVESIEKQLHDLYLSIVIRSYQEGEGAKVVEHEPNVDTAFLLQ